jgi:hypothetical protein
VQRLEVEEDPVAAAVRCGGSGSRKISWWWQSGVAPSPHQGMMNDSGGSTSKSRDNGEWWRWLGRLRAWYVKKSCP